jgi:serine/threonine protein kinase
MTDLGTSSICSKLKKKGTTIFKIFWSRNGGAKMNDPHDKANTTNTIIEVETNMAATDNLSTEPAHAPDVEPISPDTIYDYSISASSLTSDMCVSVVDTYGFSLPTKVQQYDKICFKTDCQLGKGTYGAIYLTSNDTAFKKVIVNELLYGVYTPSFDGAFIHEVSSMLTLKNCPSVLQIYNIIMSPKVSGFDMPKYHWNLRQVIKGTSDIPESVIKKILFDVVNALAYGQNKFILHRDVKPCNIMIYQDDATFSVALVDWGLSLYNYSKEFKKNEMEVQTLWYRAPEIALKLDNNNESMDMWSVGAIAMELITKIQGYFASEDVPDLLAKIILKLGLPTNPRLLAKMQQNTIIWNQIVSIVNNAKKTVQILPVSGHTPLPGSMVSHSTQHSATRITIPIKPINIMEYVIENKFDPLLGDLISKLLVWDHEYRLTPIDALNHPYFDEYRCSSTVLSKDYLTRLRQLDDYIPAVGKSNVLYSLHRFEILQIYEYMCAKYYYSAFEMALMVKYTDVVMMKCNTIFVEYYPLVACAIISICNSQFNDHLTSARSLFRYVKHLPEIPIVRYVERYQETDLDSAITNILDIMEFKLITQTAFMYTNPYNLERDPHLQKIIKYMLIMCFYNESLMFHTSQTIFGSVVYILQLLDTFKTKPLVIEMCHNMIYTIDTVKHILAFHNDLIKNNTSQLYKHLYTYILYLKCLELEKLVV